MIEASLAERIAAIIDRRFADQIETTMRLASIPSTRGAEGPAQDLIAGLLRERGYSVDDWKIEIEDIKDLPDFGTVKTDFSQARTVVGTLRPETESGRSLILQGHCSGRHVGNTAVQANHQKWRDLRPRRQ
jgi:acetylornithine deacetylase